MKNTPISNLSPTPANARANPICLHGGGGESSNNGKSLGILTKYASTPEIKGLAEIAVRRAVKYSLQNEAVKLLPNERVRFCLRHRVDASKGIEIKYNEKRKSALQQRATLR